MTRITVITAATAAATAATTTIITTVQKNATKNNDLAEKNAYGKVENVLHRQSKNHIESNNHKRISKPFQYNYIFSPFNSLFALPFFCFCYSLSLSLGRSHRLTYICSATRIFHAIHFVLVLLPFAVCVCFHFFSSIFNLFHLSYALQSKIFMHTQRNSNDHIVIHNDKNALYSTSIRVIFQWHNGKSALYIYIVYSDMFVLCCCTCVSMRLTE